MGKRWMLRGGVALTLALAAAAFVLGFFPGIEIYRGTDFVETRQVVERWNWCLGILLLLVAPGIVVWARPRIAYALLWSLWTIASSVIVFLATFDLGDWSVRTVELWPMHVFGLVIFALLFTIIAVIPIGCAVYWWVTRERPFRPVLPVARVIT